MARRSQCSSAGDNPLDPNYLPPHYREDYRLAIDALIEEDLDGYYQFLQKADVVDFLASPEIEYIQCSIKLPQQHSNHPEQHYLESGGDGSSDTYWPVHSDLDAPGLDLGWPQVHRFIGPTEVTTLVNPPEADMPSIKEQARRLIKNAQQVIALVMDMFTDVDIFADILSAARRNVAVYILLDDQNVQHFVNMVLNCRVNLDSIQFLRVRTVSGITYHCRTGKSFKGQMMDRFLFTDCRAVLSGNYSFMWSFEKIHRCMAHLFLGQLVSTFDEEFRILYAQSEPLIVENVLASLEDVTQPQKKPYPGDRPPVYREPQKFIATEVPHPEDLPRHSFDVGMDMDWKRMLPNRQEPMHRKLDQGPVDMYNRFPSQQSRMEAHPRMPELEYPPLRHSFAEGSQGRLPSHQFLQKQGLPDFENQGRQFHRGQQPYSGTGPEPDYSSYDKFWSQGYNSGEQFPEPGLPQEMEPPDSFDPVRHYLSSTANVDFDQGSEKLLPAAEVPSSSSHPKRSNFGKTYASQNSPTPSNQSDQKQSFQEPNIDRKDPVVKRGLRNWRISSYLSAFDDAEEEGLPQSTIQAADAFEEPAYPIQHTVPGIDLSLPKIPNTREFKIPTLPRASQMPMYAKATTREPSKRVSDEVVTMAPEIRAMLTPFESSSTTEDNKSEEMEPKETINPGLRKDDSFRRNYNAAVQRSSRLRSSLIFSSQLDQQDSKTAPGKQDEEEDKTEAEQTKLPFASQVLNQRRPFEWSRYKPSSFDISTTETSKPDDASGKAADKDSTRETTLKQLPSFGKSTTQTSKPDDTSGKAADEDSTSEKTLKQLPSFVKSATQTSKPDEAADEDSTRDNMLKRSTSFGKSATQTPKPDEVDSKADNKDSSRGKPSKDLSENSDLKGSVKLPDAEPSISLPLIPLLRLPQIELPKFDQPVQLAKPLLSNPSFVDMNDPDQRLMFFKELAAKRKAANAAAEKRKDKPVMIPPSHSKDKTAVKNVEAVPEKSLQNKKQLTTSSETLLEKKAAVKDAVETISTEASGSVTLGADVNVKTNKQDSHSKIDPITPQRCKEDTQGTAKNESQTLDSTSKGSSCLKVSSSEALLGNKSTTKNAGGNTISEACGSVTQGVEVSDKTARQDSDSKSDPKTPKSCETEHTRVSTTSDKTEAKNSQTGKSLPVSAESSPLSQPSEQAKLSSPALKEWVINIPPTKTDATPPNLPSLTDSPEQGTTKNEGKESSCLNVTSSKSLLGIKATSKDAGQTISTEAHGSVSLDVEVNTKTNKQDIDSKSDPHPPQNSDEKQQTKVSTNSEKTEVKNSQTGASLPVSAEAVPPLSQPSEQTKLSSPATKECSLNVPPTTTDATPPHSSRIESPEQGTGINESKTLDSTSKDSSHLVVTSSVCLGVEVNAKTNKLDSDSKSGPNTPKSSDEEEETRVSTNSEKTEVKKGQTGASLSAETAPPLNQQAEEPNLSSDSPKSSNSTPASNPDKTGVKDSKSGASLPAESAPPQSQPPAEPKLPDPAQKEGSSRVPHTMTDAPNVPSLIDSVGQGTDKNETQTLDSTSKRSSSLDASLPGSLLVKKATAEVAGETVFTEARGPVTVNDDDVSDETNKQDTHSKNDANISQSCEEEQTTLLTHSEKVEVNKDQSGASLPVSAKSAPPQSQLPTSSPPIASKSNIQHLGSPQLESSTSSPPPSSDTKAVTEVRSEFSASHASAASSSSDHNLADTSSSQSSPSPSSYGSAPHSTPVETMSSNASQEHSSSAPSSSILIPTSDKTEPQESASHPSPESSQSTETTSEKSVSPIPTLSNSTQVSSGSVSQLTSSETSLAVDSADSQCNISSNPHANDSEPSTASAQSITKTDSEESSSLISRSEKHPPESASDSVPTNATGGSEVSSRVASASPKDVKADDSISHTSTPSTEPSDKNATVNPVSQTHPPPEHSPTETKSDVTSEPRGPASSPSNTNVPPDVTPTEVIPPSDYTGSSSSTTTTSPVTGSSSHLSESGVLVLSCKDEKTETNKSTMDSPLEASISKLSPSDSSKSPDKSPSNPPVTGSSSPLSESGVLVVSSKDAKTETNMSTMDSPVETSISKLSPSDASKSPDKSPSTPPVTGSSSILSESGVLVVSSKDERTETNKSTMDSPLETSISKLSPSDSSKSPDKSPSTPPVTGSSFPLSESGVLVVSSKDAKTETNKSTMDSPLETSISKLSPSDASKSPDKSPSTPPVTGSSSPLSESGVFVVSSKDEKTETNKSTVDSPLETSISKLSPSDSSKSPDKSPSTESSSDLIEPSSNISQVPTEPNLPGDTPKSVTSERRALEPTTPAENSGQENHCEMSKGSDPGKKNPEDAEGKTNADKSTKQESDSHEKPSDEAKQGNISEQTEITSGEVVPPSPLSKQPKTSQARYNSTANVLSSSNLRDDTKLLLGQISANSQSRYDSTKESAVTDDQKGDEADKNAKREKERRSRFTRGQSLNTEEREKLLEKIQSIRKENKVYSRFQMAP